MDQENQQNTLRLRVIAPVAKVAIYLLALIGLFWLIGGAVARLITSPFFVTEIAHSLPAPEGPAIATVEVRKGGFGTVWTTRVFLRPGGDDRWIIYQTKDSDFEPPIKWADQDTLLVGLPCDRFDHVSNPDDWKRSDPAKRSIKVRFIYPEECSSVLP